MPVDLTSPSLDPTSVLIDSVMSRTFLIATLASPASDEVTFSILAAMWSTRLSRRSSVIELVSISLSTLVAMSVSCARRQLVNVLQDVFQDRQDRPDVGHEIAHAGRLAHVLDLVAVLELRLLLLLAVGAATDRRARIDLQVVLAEQRRRLLRHHGVRPELDPRLHVDGDLRLRGLGIELALVDLADRDAGGLHARLLEQARGVLEQRPDR